MKEPVARTYRSQGLQLHYADWGRDGAPILLLLHGGRDHCRNWDWLAQSFCDRYRIIAPDLRGHGDSDHVSGGAYTMSSWVYDIATLIDLLDVPQLDIVAHSLGGNIALRYAGIYPERVRRLVAIEGLGPSPKYQAEMESVPMAQRLAKWIADARAREGRRPRAYASIAEAAARMQAQFPHLSPEITHHLTLYGVRREADGYHWKFDPALYVPHLDDIPRPDIRTLWQNIRCPTLLVYGCDSWASNPAEDGRIHYLPQAELLRVPKAGHWVHHDQFALFRDAVAEFLARP